jgi:hypothetical protein
MAWIMVRNRMINLDHVVEVEWERNGECYRVRMWTITGKKVLDEYIAKERLERIVQVLVYATKAIQIHLREVKEDAQGSGSNDLFGRG